jgi:hypothetical protein
LLNAHVMWLFDDTRIISNDGELIMYCVKHSSILTHPPKTNLMLLQNFGIAASGMRHPTQSRDPITVDESLSGGGWIPFTEEFDSH